MKNIIQLFSALVGCHLLSATMGGDIGEILMRAMGLYLILQGIVLFILSELKSS